MTLKEDITKSFGDNIVLTGNAIVDKKVLTIPVSPSLDIVLNVVCSVGKIPMSGAIKGVMPLMIAQAIVMFLSVLFLQIVMWPLQWMTR